MIYIGLPQWSHPKWARLGITSLEEYARHFNCVEGNTTLYALPKAEIVERWYAQTTDDFRFCFKFPPLFLTGPRCVIATIWYRRFTRPAPLETRIGQYWLQLPAAFGPRDLPPYGSFLMRSRHVYLWRRSSSSVFLTKVRMNSGSIAGYTRAA